MKLDFAKYYHITSIAKKHSKVYDEYEKIFICCDTWDFWIARLLKGYRFDGDEGYVEDEDTYILERNKVEKQYKEQTISTLEELQEILDEDDLGNWDCFNVKSVEEAVEMLDGGYGIETLENLK